MRKTIIAASALALSISASSPVLAKGCIRGAIAGGVAGHYAHHHAMSGAVAGCVAAHYYYKHKAAQRAKARQVPAPH